MMRKFWDDEVLDLNMRTAAIDILGSYHTTRSVKPMSKCSASNLLLC
jgi:hypothetical protein